MSDNKEILERVLLLMKYNNKMTLSENKVNIFEQQIGLDSYYEKKSQSELGTAKDWKPSMQEVDGFFGKMSLPLSAKYVIYPDGLKFIKNGRDGNGDFFYWKTMSAKYGLQNDYEISDGKGGKIKINGDTKFYTPTDDYMSQFAGKVSRFTIPKGTIVPTFTETEWFDSKLDKWGEAPLEKDISFKLICQLNEENFYKSINPKLGDPSRGYDFSKGYFRLDGDKYVAYRPKDYIQLNSPDYVFWLNYGFQIELIVSIIITILSEGFLGEHLFTVLAERGLITAARKGIFKYTVDALLNGVFNLGIANYHFENNNNAAGALSTICAFVPLMVKFNSKIASIFMRTSPELEVICNEIIDSVRKNFSKLSQDNPKYWMEWYYTLSKDAKDVVNNIGKLSKSEVESSLKSIVEHVSGKVATSKYTTKTILRTLLSKSGNLSSFILKFLGNFLVIGGEIMMVFKSIEKIYGRKLEDDERVAITAFIAQLTEEGVDIEQAEKEWIDSSEEDKKEFIQKTTEVLPDTTIDRIYENIKGHSGIPNIESGCPNDIVMDTIYWDENKFIGSESLFNEYPGCRTKLEK